MCAAVVIFRQQRGASQGDGVGSVLDQIGVAGGTREDGDREIPRRVQDQVRAAAQSHCAGDAVAGAVEFPGAGAGHGEVEAGTRGVGERRAESVGGVVVRGQREGHVRRAITHRDGPGVGEVQVAVAVVRDADADRIHVAGVGDDAEAPVRGGPAADIAQRAALPREVGSRVAGFSERGGHAAIGEGEHGMGSQREAVGGIAQDGASRVIQRTAHNEGARSGPLQLVGAGDVSENAAGILGVDAGDRGIEADIARHHGGARAAAYSQRAECRALRIDGAFGHAHSGEADVVGESSGDVCEEGAAVTDRDRAETRGVLRVRMDAARVDDRAAGVEVVGDRRDVSCAVLHHDHRPEGRGGELFVGNQHADGEGTDVPHGSGVAVEGIGDGQGEDAIRATAGDAAGAGEAAGGCLAEDDAARAGQRGGADGQREPAIHRHGLLGDNAADGLVRGHGLRTGHEHEVIDPGGDAARCHGGRVRLDAGELRAIPAGECRVVAGGGGEVRGDGEVRILHPARDGDAAELHGGHRAHRGARGRGVQPAGARPECHAAVAVGQHDICRGECAARGPEAAVTGDRDAAGERAGGQAGVGERTAGEDDPLVHHRGGGGDREEGIRAELDSARAVEDAVRADVHLARDDVQAAVPGTRVVGKGGHAGPVALRQRVSAEVEVRAVEGQRRIRIRGIADDEAVCIEGEAARPCAVPIRNNGTAIEDDRLVLRGRAVALPCGECAADIREDRTRAADVVILDLRVEMAAVDEDVADAAAGGGAAPDELALAVLRQCVGSTGDVDRVSAELRAAHRIDRGVCRDGDRAARVHADAARGAAGVDVAAEAAGGAGAGDGDGSGAEPAGRCLTVRIQRRAAGHDHRAVAQRLDVRHAERAGGGIERPGADVRTADVENAVAGLGEGAASDHLAGQTHAVNAGVDAHRAAGAQVHAAGPVAGGPGRPGAGADVDGGVRAVGRHAAEAQLDIGAARHIHALHERTRFQPVVVDVERAGFERAAGDLQEARTVPAHGHRGLRGIQDAAGEVELVGHAVPVGEVAYAQAIIAEHSVTAVVRVLQGSDTIRLKCQRASRHIDDARGVGGIA